MWTWHRTKSQNVRRNLGRLSAYAKDYTLEFASDVAIFGIASFCVVGVTYGAGRVVKTTLGHVRPP